jgi:hypothetical protein
MDFFDPQGAVRAKIEKFRTGRLVARSWQIEDLLLAMELWGDPAVTALIDCRGKLTEAELQEKLYAEIDREKSCGLQYWALFDHRNGDFVGCSGLRPWVYTPGEADIEVGFREAQIDIETIAALPPPRRALGHARRRELSWPSFPGRVCRLKTTRNDCIPTVTAITASGITVMHIVSYLAYWAVKTTSTQ